ncbi:MAG TPA: hypothetical protein DCL66_02240 [Gammaproteobacteria bacterium]|nr:hypothetical protein [Gammaproteobacteria bacterium]
MSKSEIPSYVDTRKVFLQEGNLVGTIVFSRMKRFQECLLENQGNVQVELEFSANKSKQRIIIGKLTASAPVACQRCLEAVQIDLEESFILALVRQESDIDKLEEPLDPWICEDHKLDVAALIEEQLLLCLPIVSTHDDKGCLTNLGYDEQKNATIDGASQDSSKNPFAILKTLKD